MLKEKLWTRRMKRRMNIRSRSDNIQRKPNGRRNYIIGQNPKEKYQGTRDTKKNWKKKKDKYERTIE